MASVMVLLERVAAAVILPIASALPGSVVIAGVVSSAAMLMSDHVAQALIVDNADEDLDLHLGPVQPGVHGLRPVVVEARIAQLLTEVVDRAVVLSSYHMRNLSRWTHWDESSCESIVDAPDREGELHGACVYSRSVSFSVAPRAASDPGFRLRVVMKFPGATAVVHTTT